MQVVRTAAEDDWPLLADSFIHGCKTVPCLSGVPRTVLIRMLETCITDPSWNIDILCDDSARDEILAWCVWHPGGKVLWTATKLRYRGLRFGTALLKHALAKMDGTTIECFAIPPGLTNRARDVGYRLVHRPFMVVT